jgi:histone chaperone ASF1
MSLINVLNVEVLDNPASFLTPFIFEITFECLSDLNMGNFYLIKTWNGS